MMMIAVGPSRGADGVVVGKTGLLRPGVVWYGG